MKTYKLREATVQDQLRSYIKRTFNTQREAADYFGVTQASISHAVNGKRRPSSAMLEAAGIHV